MTKVNYAYNDLNDNTASAYGRSLHISTKVAINICNALRYKSASKAIKYLDAVIAMKRAIPYTRFTDGVGHRRGAMAAGRYPIKAAALIRDLIKSVASNAENKGFSDDLKIIHLCAHRASSPMRQGRQRSRSAKRTHIEVVVKEQIVFSKKISQKAKSSKVASKESSKVEVKIQSNDVANTKKEKVSSEETPTVETKSEGDKQ